MNCTKHLENYYYNPLKKYFFKYPVCIVENKSFLKHFLKIFPEIRSQYNGHHLNYLVEC